MSRRSKNWLVFFENALAYFAKNCLSLIAIPCIRIVISDAKFYPI